MPSLTVGLGDLLVPASEPVLSDTDGTDSMVASASTTPATTEALAQMPDSGFVRADTLQLFEDKQNNPLL